jgi:hypothetical protein
MTIHIGNGLSCDYSKTSVLQVIDLLMSRNGVCNVTGSAEFDWITANVRR